MHFWLLRLHASHIGNASAIALLAAEADAKRSVPLPGEHAGQSRRSSVRTARPEPLHLSTGPPSPVAPYPIRFWRWQRSCSCTDAQDRFPGNLVQIRMDDASMELHGQCPARRGTLQRKWLYIPHRAVFRLRRGRISLESCQQHAGPSRSTAISFRYGASSASPRRNLRESTFSPKMVPRSEVSCPASGHLRIAASHLRGPARLDR